MDATQTPRADTHADTTEAARIARFALDLRLEDVPQDVVQLAKEHLLDALGSAIASTRFDYGRVMLQAGTAFGSGDDASAIGSTTRLPAASAALVNGVLAHGLDFDDTHIAAIYHATSQAMAAAFAAGEATGASGRDVLAAFIVGMEVGCRLAQAAAGKLHDRGFHPTSVCGTFAAACAAGRLYGLKHDVLVSALGLSGSLASGILERGDSWLKRLHPGWAAHSGLSAVLIARAGFIGPPSVLEGRRGFYMSHIGSVPQGASLPSHELGVTWLSRGIALKPYPCCHFIHAFADAALELRGQFDIADIERIDCPLTAALHKMVAEPRERCIRPATPYSALFSVHYVVAAALVRGRVDLALFHDEPLDSPDVLQVCAKTHCIDDPLSDYPSHFPGEVIVTLKSGQIFRSRKPASLGTPDVPLSLQKICAKFSTLATRVVPEAVSAEIQGRILDLQDEASLDPVMSLLRAA